MSAAEFLMAVKSSLDYYGNQLVTTTGADAGISLDDTLNVEELLAGSSTVVLWQLVTLSPEPKDPLYRLVFGYGGKTSKDPGNYALTELQEAVSGVFYQGAELPLRDYSGPTPGAVVGALLITQASLTPQQVDNESGLRMFLLTGRALRLV